MSTDDVHSPAGKNAVKNTPITLHGRSTTTDDGPRTPQGVQLGGGNDGARITPDGQDTPKWADLLARREEEEEEVAQTPAKTVWTHDPTSGITPPGGGDAEKAILRPAHLARTFPNLPGSSRDNPTFLDTPTRDKK